MNGDLKLDHASLSNESGTALSGNTMAVRRRLLLRDLTVRGLLDLTGAELGELVVADELSGSTLPTPVLVASGWRVGDLMGAVRSDRRATRRWLETAPDFVAQPWHELARVHERNGQPADATYLRLHASRQATRSSRWRSKMVRVFYDLLVGYGYRPLLAAVWLVLAVLSASFIVSTNRASFEPGNLPQARAALSAQSGQTTPTPTGKTHCKELAGYPCLRAGLYALETVLPPTVAIGQNAAWRPSATWIIYSLTFLKAFGWLLTALLLAGVTGLLRRT